jgi:single-strand selective monofunctional uracil DNA glycosylase
MESPVVLFGLNPGPYGMGQTGIPFTDVKRIKAKLPRLRDALVAGGERVELPGLAPADLQPFLSMTHEASSVRVYLFLEKAFGDAETGSSKVFVANPCPLLFMDAAGKNRTPADFKRAANAGIGREGASKLLAHLQGIRVECALDAARVATPRAAVLLGRDVDAALGDALRSELGKARVIAYQHPARAIPEVWADGLVSELRNREAF